MAKISRKEAKTLIKNDFRVTGLGALAAGVLVLASASFWPQSVASRVGFVRECGAKDLGTWNWGEAPSGCEASRFGETARIKFVYHDFVFDRTASSQDEHRKDYVTSIHALLRDLSTEYIKAKKPDAQPDEVKAFVEAIEAVAHQETYWSHYRIGKDGRYKLMTGDQNISHGMMQINQKYHASKGRDNSFDIVGNVGFGIEHFYAKWEMATKAKCIYRVKNQKRDQTLLNITRAAYSAYNGGSDAICRWTNPEHPWAKNDKNYYNKLSGKTWSEWVRNEDHKLAIDLACIRSDDDLCAIAKPRNGESLSGRPLLLDDGSTCLLSDAGRLECASDLRVFKSLAALAPELTSSGALKISRSDSSISKLPRINHENRMALLKAANLKFAVIGDVIVPESNLPLLGAIGGAPIAILKKGTGFQVLDVELSLDAKAIRYYKVRLNAKTEGWVESGTAETTDSLLAIHSKAFGDVGKNVIAWVPYTGATVQVVKNEGIKLLVAPETKTVRAEVKGQLSKGETAYVEEVQILGSANEIWLKVRRAQDTGYVFAGRTYPSSTTQEWFKVKQ